MAATVLVIDGDEPTGAKLAALLQGRGYEVYAADSAQAGLRMAYQQQPDLVLLDAVLPDRDGWSLCRQLRELSDMPIIFVSAQAGKAEVVRGLELGADDFVAKPFDDDELVARVRARLRRAPPSRLTHELALGHGDIRVNFIRREVWVRGSLKHLTPKEFNLLAVLARNAGRSVPRGELAAEAWGEEYSDAIDSLKLYIHYLRRKLEVNPQQPELILTARGVGYRLVKG